MIRSAYADKKVWTALHVCAKCST